MSDLGIGRFLSKIYKDEIYCLISNYGVDNFNHCQVKICKRVRAYQY